MRPGLIETKCVECGTPAKIFTDLDNPATAPLICCREGELGDDKAYSDPGLQYDTNKTEEQNTMEFLSSVLNKVKSACKDHDHKSDTNARIEELRKEKLQGIEKDRSGELKDLVRLQIQLRDKNEKHISPAIDQEIKDKYAYFAAEVEAEAREQREWLTYFMDTLQTLRRSGTREDLIKAYALTKKNALKHVEMDRMVLKQALIYNYQTEISFIQRAIDEKKDLVRQLAEI